MRKLFLFMSLVLVGIVSFSRPSIFSESLIFNAYLSPESRIHDNQTSFFKPVNNGSLIVYYPGLMASQTELPVVNDTLIIYCTGDVAEPLHAEGENLKWYTSPGGSFTTDAPVPSTDASGTFNFYVTQTIDDIESDPDTIRVEIKEGVELLLSDYVINSTSDNVVLSVSSNYSGEGSVSYNWNGLNVNTSGTSINYSSLTPEALSVTATAENGCNDEDEVLVLEEPDVIFTESHRETYQLEDGSVIKTYHSDQIWRYKDLTLQDTLWSYSPGLDYSVTLTNDFFIIDSTIINVTRHFVNNGEPRIVAAIRAISLDGKSINEKHIPSGYPSHRHNEMNNIKYSFVDDDKFIIAFGNRLLMYNKNLDVVREVDSWDYDFLSCKYRDQKIYALYAENNPEQLWNKYYLGIYDLNFNQIEEKEFYSHAREGKINNLDLDTDSAGQLYIIEDSYAEFGTEGDVVLIKYDNNFDEIWLKHLVRYDQDYAYTSSCITLNNGNILVLSGGNTLYNIGEDPESSFMYYTGGDGMFGDLWQVDNEIINLSGMSGSWSHNLNIENGKFVPWYFKAELNHVQTFNPNGTICSSGEETGLKLDMNLLFLYGLYDENITWSNGTTGRESIFKTPGAHYANFTWGNGNIGITDTFIVEDHYTVIENPAFNINKPSNHICDGQENTVSFEIMNDNGMPYKYENLTLNREFDETETLSEEGEYEIRITDSHGCKTDTSVQLLVKQAFSDNICLVTVDEETGKNRIFWNKTQQEGTQSYRVLRGLGHTEVGAKAFGDDNYLIDTEVDPAIMAYRYFLETTDTCGNSIISEISHKTIHLTANKGTSGEVNLIWQPYEGLDFFQYNIYRSTDSVNFGLIGGMEYDPSISQYTDYDPPAGDLYYQIGIEGDFVCNTGSSKKSTNQGFEEILSNIKSLKTTGTENNFSNSHALKVYPNPVTESLTIEYPDNDGNSSLRILNVLGEIVYEIYMDSDKLQLELNSNFSSGLYLVQLVDEDGVMKGSRMIWKE